MEAQPELPDATSEKAYPLAWLAASPQLRAHVEWLTGQNQTRGRPRARALVAGVEYSRRSSSALSPSPPLGQDGGDGSSTARFVLEPCTYAPSRIKDARLCLHAWLRPPTPEGGPGQLFAACGLRHALWWLQYCATRDGCFSVELALHLRRQLKGQTKAKGRSEDGIVGIEELLWPQAGGAPQPPSRYAESLAALGAVLRVLRCDGIRFSEEAFGSLPRLLPGVAAVCFSQCSVEVGRAAASPSPPAVSPWLDGAAYQWEHLCYVACDHVGGEAFWRGVAGSLLLPPAPAADKPPLRATTLAPLRVVSIAYSSINANQLGVVMDAVAARQNAAHRSPSFTGLELELGFLKARIRKARVDWLVACAGANGDGLRSVMLPSTQLNLARLADALVEVAAHYRASSPAPAPDLLLYLLNIRWNIEVRDDFLTQLVGGGVHARNLLVAGTYTTAAVAKTVADCVSP